MFKLGKSNYYANLFEYDSDKTPEENDKAFKDYLHKAEKELFPAKINKMDIIKEYKEKVFVCFDGTLTDSEKANLALNLRLKTI